MNLILIPGLWLDGTIWAETADALRRAGHRVDALTLPGQGDGNTLATYGDQVEAVLGAVDRAEGEPYVVGHSAAAALAWVAADARSERLAGVALLGGFPVADGQTYADFFPCVDGVMPFPGWAPFLGPDTADLDEQSRRRLEDRMITVPEAVALGTVRLSDRRRFDVPTTMICPEFSAAEARTSIASGEHPELAATSRLTLVDLSSGHWPMVSCQDRLAAVLVEAADGSTR